jgi:hypothetical protein
VIDKSKWCAFEGGVCRPYLAIVTRGEALRVKLVVVLRDENLMDGRGGWEKS